MVDAVGPYPAKKTRWLRHEALCPTVMPPAFSRSLSGARCRSSGRNPVAQMIASACWKAPFDQRTPSGSIDENIVVTLRRPRSIAAWMRRVRGTPVVETIDGSARPSRAAASCSATAFTPDSMLSSWSSRNSTGRRATQVMLPATFSSSIRKPIALVPPPTTMTSLSRKSSASP